MKPPAGIAPIIENHKEAITDRRIAQRMRTRKGGELVCSRKRTRRAAFAFVMLLISSPAWAEVKVHGATTVAFGLMNPQKATIEQLAAIPFI